ncbi:hypothetical protein [Kiloniella laminariae]|uniref:hypothetical protein n=1 Tax=Kiloniella laminariae TaxID=454162 RepID=UPI00037BB971|nr:hypothetical protein [Kiloniella laminariae]
MANYTQIYSTNDQAGAAQIEQMRALEDIDVDRLVWDVEYREVIKESLRGSAPSDLSNQNDESGYYPLQRQA